jgi:transaldolase
MPEKTLDALADHGEVRGDTIAHSYEEANRVLNALAALGISYAEVTELLEKEGVEKFIVSWNELLDTVTGALEAAKLYLSLHGKNLSATDKTVFISLLADRLAEKGIRPEEADFLPPAAAKENFTYVKNLYADEAYDVFAQGFSDPRLFYSESLKDAVSAVAEGRAGYCLLPLEEKGGIRLASISQMLYRSDLRIASVTPVYGYGEETGLTYALISRGFCIPPVAGEDDRYLELRLPKENCRLAELLSAAEFFGALVYRIQTMQLEGESEPKPFYSIVLRAEGRDFVLLLMYLFTFVKDFAPIGIYSNLEA